MKIEGTHQELFDRVVRGLASQGWERSVVFARGVTNCAYRGVADTRCAVGWLLDGDVTDAMNLLGIGELDRLGLVKVDPLLLSFLGQLQRLHDGSRTPEVMERRYREYAGVAGLLWPLVDEHGGAYAE